MQTQYYICTIKWPSTSLFKLLETRPLPPFYLGREGKWFSDNYPLSVKRQAFDTNVHIKSFHEKFPCFGRIQVALGALTVVPEPHSRVEWLHTVMPEDLQQMRPIQHFCILDGTVHVAGPCRFLSATCMTNQCEKEPQADQAWTWPLGVWTRSTGLWLQLFARLPVWGLTY